MSAEDDLTRELHYLGMTKKELEAVVPDGIYTLGSGAITGKGGYIMYLLSITESMKKQQPEIVWWMYWYHY